MRMFRYARVALFCSMMPTAAWGQPANVTEADVCVYGGTSGGVTAAVAAARLGKKVVLVEPGRHLGGMSSGGLGMTDIGSTETIGGLSREFYQRVYRYYTKPEAWKFQRREDYLAWLPKIWGVDGPRMEEIQAQFLFEPHAAERVFNEMAQEAGVRVVYGERLDLKNGVAKDGTSITSPRDGERPRVRRQGVHRRDLRGRPDGPGRREVHRRPRAEQPVRRDAQRRAFPFTPATSSRKDRAPTSSPATRRAGCCRASSRGRPAPKASGRPPRAGVQLPPLPHRRAREPRAVTKPEGYDPRRVRAARRHIATMKDVKPGPRKHAAIGLRGNGGDLAINFELMPNRKTDSNNNCAFSHRHVSASTTTTPTPTTPRAAEDLRGARDLPAGPDVVPGDDPRVPEEVRDEMQPLGPAEGRVHRQRQLAAPALRPRGPADGRRLRHDRARRPRRTRRRTTGRPGVATRMDSHNVHAVRRRGRHVLQRGRRAGSSPASRRIPIGYRALVRGPASATTCSSRCCLSASHIAYGSIRMEPVFMMLGQPPATAAAWRSTARRRASGGLRGAAGATARGPADPRPRHDAGTRRRRDPGRRPRSPRTPSSSPT